MKRVETYLETVLLTIPAVTVPMGTAWFVYRSMVNNLGAPGWLAMATAAGLEVYALASMRNVLTLRGYNVNRRRSDSPAPTWAALVLVGVYSLVVVAITYLLDPGVSWALLLWPVLSLAVLGNEALRQDHRRRLAEIAQEKAERKAERKERKDSGNLPSGSGKARKVTGKDWRYLPQEDRALVATMTTVEIQAAYQVSERTARNWRAAARSNGHHKVEEVT